VRLRIIAITLMFVQSVAAAGVTTAGGTRSCGDWTSNGTRLEDAIWLLGYLSGVNAATPGAGDLLKGFSNVTLVAWMDKHCRDNPLDRIVDAADKMTLELYERTQLTHPKSKTAH
jgi:hypothetical protein